VHPVKRCDGGSAGCTDNGYQFRPTAFSVKIAEVERVLFYLASRRGGLARFARLEFNDKY
jgi:hypothetical protein